MTIPGVSLNWVHLVPADYLLLGRISEYSTKRTNARAVIVNTEQVKATVRILFKVVEIKTGKVITAFEALEENVGLSYNTNVLIVFGDKNFDDAALGTATRAAIAKAIEATRIALIPEYCYGCGEKIRQGQKFCAKCGEPTPPWPCPNKKCKELLRREDAFCPVCGTKNLVPNAGGTGAGTGRR